MFVVNFHTDNHGLTMVLTLKQKHAHTKKYVAGGDIDTHYSVYNNIYIWI